MTNGFHSSRVAGSAEKNGTCVSQAIAMFDRRSGFSGKRYQVDGIVSFGLYRGRWGSKLHRRSTAYLLS